jgi:hypothetical protein
MIGSSQDAVTQHTTSCCSMQVVDITLAEQASTNITSLRMVQQKHCGPKYKLNIILLQTKAWWYEMLPLREHLKCLVFIATEKLQIIKHRKNSTTYSYTTVARFFDYDTILLVSLSSSWVLVGRRSIAYKVIHAFDSAREIWLLIEDVLFAFDGVQSCLVKLFTV